MTDWNQNPPPPPAAQPSLEDRLRGAATEVESELKRWIAYVNDQVVPDVRRNGSAALKTAAAELDRLARRMESPDPPPGRKEP